MAWTDLTFTFGQVLTSTQMTQLDDNFEALTNRDSGAPNLTMLTMSSTLSTQNAGGTAVVVFTSTDVNTITGASLSSGTFTLPAGTYFFSSEGSVYQDSGSAVSSLVVAISLSLYNLSDTAYIQTGPTSSPRDSTYGGNTVKYMEAATSVSGVFTVAAEKTVQIRVYSDGDDLDDLAVSFIKLA